MKSYKNFSLLFLILFFACSVQVILVATSNLAQSSQQEEYPKYSTDKYEYKIFIDSKIADPMMKVNLEPIVTDTYTFFYIGKVHTVLRQEIKDGLLITILETWTTKDPLFFKSKSLLITGGLLSLMIASWYAKNYWIPIKSKSFQADNIRSSVNENKDSKEINEIQDNNTIKKDVVIKKKKLKKVKNQKKKDTDEVPCPLSGICLDIREAFEKSKTQVPNSFND
ncbi:MAG: hypothetical protein ACXWL2_02455 [Candidatus Chromulinivorax sp.]